MFLYDSVRIDNQAAGSYTLVGDGDIVRGNDSPAFTNEGTFRKTGGTVTSTVSVPFTNTSPTTIDATSSDPTHWTIRGDGDGNDHALFGTPFLGAWITPLAATVLLSGLLMVQAAPDTWAAFIKLGVVGTIPYAVTVAGLEARPRIAAGLRRWLRRLPVTRVK